MSTAPIYSLANEARARAESAAWAQFSSPRDSAEFYASWLAILCVQIERVQGALLVLRVGETGEYGAAAVWPDATRDMQYLGAIAERALKEGRGFAAGADAMLTGELAACAGSCGPGSLHFINGLFESHRNRAPIVLIASQIVRDELGFDFPQEVDFKSVYASCSVFCEEIRTPAQARRMTAMAAQAARVRLAAGPLLAL